MLGVTLSNAVISNTDILMLAAFQDKATVGIYSVYIKLGALISIAISAVNSMYAPKAAKLFGSGKMLELKTLTKRATLLTFTFSFSILIAILLFHKLILSLYGPAFLAHVAAFYILLFSTILNAFYGSIGMLLNMTGKQNEFFLIMLSAATLNIVLNYFLIPLLGPIGAALASLATVFFWNSAAAILVKSSYGFTTFPSLSTSK
jgi:O-antigen/teichoic acid export membrane protein